MLPVFCKSINITVKSSMRMRNTPSNPLLSRKSFLFMGDRCLGAGAAPSGLAVVSGDGVTGAGDVAYVWLDVCG